MFRFARSDGLDQPKVDASSTVPGLGSMVLSNVTAAQLLGQTWSHGKYVVSSALTADAAEKKLKDEETLSARLIEWRTQALA